MQKNLAMLLKKILLKNSISILQNIGGVALYDKYSNASLPEWPYQWQQHDMRRMVPRYLV